MLLCILNDDFHFAIIYNTPAFTIGIELNHLTKLGYALFVFLGVLWVHIGIHKKIYSDAHGISDVCRLPTQKFDSAFVG